MAASMTESKASLEAIEIELLIAQKNGESIQNVILKNGIRD